MSWLTQTLLQALQITALVGAMMLAIDLLHVLSRARSRALLRGGLWRQYLLAAALGATPGCLGAFGVVSLYAHGSVGFGALVAAMLATSGDEAFVMLSMFPRTALGLFVALAAIAVVGGRLADAVVARFGIRLRGDCHLEVYHAGRETGGHYLRRHLWEHIVRVHLWRVFLWTFGALLLVHAGLGREGVRTFVTGHMGWVLVLAVVAGVVPESGPHLVFAVLFAEGAVPFSVLLASSLVQDGHGMLPLLSTSVRDAALAKGFNLLVGLLAGGTLMWLGL